jgi:SAM-dependent methyltransferase
MNNASDFEIKNKIKFIEKNDIQKKFDSRYKEDYFDTRNSDDPKRVTSFKSEASYIKQYVSKGKLLDVGCSTGEFLDYVEWDGDRFGVEISDFAAKKAFERGVSVSNVIPTDMDEMFDLVIFRGTIQHVDTPFYDLQKVYKLLKKGGYLVFLATPNANSPFYKIWNTLPALNPELNFFIPSDIVLKNSLKNIGFQFVSARYPYFTSPYSNVIRDHIYFVARLFGIKKNFPFHRSMMELMFKK